MLKPPKKRKLVTMRHTSRLPMSASKFRKISIGLTNSSCTRMVVARAPVM